MYCRMITSSNRYTYLLIKWIIFIANMHIWQSEAQMTVGNFKKLPGLKQAGVLQTIRPSLNTCCIMCLNDPTCVSVSLNTATKTCYTDHGWDAQQAVPDNSWNLYLHPKIENWLLVFKASQGTGDPMYDLWSSSSYTTVDSSSFVALDTNCNCHYKSPLVERWGSLNVKEIRLSLFHNNQEVVQLVFNGVGSTKLDWFTPVRLQSATPWNDLSSDPSIYANQPNAYFDMLGGFGFGEGCRLFYLNWDWNGCPNDKTWMMVRDKECEDNAWCVFEKGRPVPTFIYSKMNTYAIMGDTNQYDYADVFAIFIKIGD